MRREEFSKIILRLSLSLVFLYFGALQAMNPTKWTMFVPEFITNIISANNIVLFNGILEITLGIFLLFGLFTKISSLILSVHLIAITISVGFNTIGISDFGLSMAALAIFFNGIDVFSIDNLLIKKPIINIDETKK